MKNPPNIYFNNEVTRTLHKRESEAMLCLVFAIIIAFRVFQRLQSVRQGLEPITCGYQGPSILHCIQADWFESVAFPSHPC